MIKAETHREKLEESIRTPPNFRSLGNFRRTNFCFNLLYLGDQDVEIRREILCVCFCQGSCIN